MHRDGTTNTKIKWSCKNVQKQKTISERKIVIELAIIEGIVHNKVYSRTASFTRLTFDFCDLMTILGSSRAHVYINRFKEHQVIMETEINRKSESNSKKLDAFSILPSYYRYN